jgi:acylphosphatase
MAQRLEYASDVEGGAPVRVRFAISGRLDVAHYLDFVGERARWLGLCGSAERSGADAVTVLAAGPEALVGALEMACLLGPLDALVESLVPADSDEPVPDGFVVLQK